MNGIHVDVSAHYPGGWVYNPKRILGVPAGGFIRMRQTFSTTRIRVCVSGFFCTSSDTACTWSPRACARHPRWPRAAIARPCHQRHCAWLLWRPAAFLVWAFSFGCSCADWPRSLWNLARGTEEVQHEFLDFFNQVVICDSFGLYHPLISNIMNWIVLLESAF